MIELYSSSMDCTYDFEDELSKIEFFNTIKYEHCLTYNATWAKNDSGEWFHKSCTKHGWQNP